ncbi:MAG: ABC transporter ATP-binding protein [Pseudomonadota bacterium]
MLLSVDDLSIYCPTGPLVRNVSFDLDRNACIGIVGESGSGKSLICHAVNGLLDESLTTSGRVTFDGKALFDETIAARRALRGDSIAMILQSPMTAFNPLFTIGNQAAETLRAHRGLSRRHALDEMAEMFVRMRLKDPKRIFGRYPHELSGGMLQRIMIAFATILEPDLLIADEPTTAIDYISQREVIEELQKIRDEKATAIIFVSHDLSLVSHIADDVMVMEGGRCVEQGGTRQVFLAPKHGHTRYLIDSRKRLISGYSQMMSTIDVA